MKRSPTLAVMPNVNLEDLLFSSPLLVRMLGFVMLFCVENQITPVITSWEREYDHFSQSTTHQEGRAFDVSIRKEWGWSEAKIAKFEKYMLENTKDIAATSKKSGKITPVYRHEVADPKTKETLGDHLHCQVKRFP